MTLPQSDAAHGFAASWYRRSADRPPLQPVLQESIDTDVCIIGGGFTGLSAALELCERGVPTVLLEAHEVGAGASGRNGGILGTGQRVEQLTLEQWLGAARARELWDVAAAANALVRERIRRYRIDCELVDGELTVAHRRRRLPELLRNADHLMQRYHHGPLTVLDASDVAARLGTDRFHGGVIDPVAAHLHPLKLVYGELRAALAAGLRVFEGSRVVALDQQPERVEVRTATGLVRARRLIVGCNGYLDGLLPGVDRYQMPINNFVLATEPLSAAMATEINRDNLAVVDTRFVVNYWHLSADRRLIYGGGETYGRRYPRDIAGLVRQHLVRTYPQLGSTRVATAWGGTLAISLNRMPHFGSSDGTVFWAQAYSGHGVAMAHLAGQLCARAAIEGAGQGDFARLAALPHRPFPGGRWLRWPSLVAGMLFYSLLDRW